MPRLKAKQITPGTVGQVLQTLAGPIAGWATPSGGGGGVLSWGGDVQGGEYFAAYERPDGLATTAFDWGSRILLPRAGTLKNLHCRRENSTNAYTVRVVVNGVVSALTLTVGNGSTSGSETTTSVSVAAGDRVEIDCSSGNLPSRCQVSLEFA